eukprot:gene11511-15421_t
MQSYRSLRLLKYQPLTSFQVNYLSRPFSVETNGGDEIIDSKVGEKKEKKKWRLIKHKGNRPIVVTRKKINEELDKAAISKNLPWRLMGATILHRYPTITEEAKQWQMDYYDVQDKIKQKQRAWLVNELKGTGAAKYFPDEVPSYEEIYESLPFKPASRITEADEKNDRRSLDRRLQDNLYLIVKRNRSEHSWQFPQGKLLPEETMRMTSERIIDRAVGQTERWFMSNCPVGHYSYEYPESLQKSRQNFGAKVFFYRAQLISGNVKLQTKLYTDYAWISGDEVGEYFDEPTAEYIRNILPI